MEKDGGFRKEATDSVAFWNGRGYIIRYDETYGFQTGKASRMKTFEGLFEELKKKAAAADPDSGTVKELQRGKHFIGKKVVEEAGEVWMAAEYEGREKTAEEISQLLYHLQVMMIANELELEDVYKYL